MKLKLDENLGKSEASFLRHAGHDVQTVFQQQLCGADDRELAAKSAEEGRCLVTLDMDFANPFAFPPRRYCGIAVLRLPSRGGPRDLRNALESLVAGLGNRSIEGELWIVQHGRIREYRPDDPTGGVEG